MTSAPEAPISPWLSDDEWQWAQQHLPIVCVDVLPLQLDADGAVARIGLILRDSPFGSPRWCHVGGRVNVHETLSAAARRHARETLALDDAALAPTRDWDDPHRPQHVVQWFTQPGVGDTFGHDPRKHSVAVTFGLTLPTDVTITPDHEALDFAWFAPDALPDDLWPGADLVIAAVTGGTA